MTRSAVAVIAFACAAALGLVGSERAGAGRAATVEIQLLAINDFHGTSSRRRDRAG